MGFGSCGDLEAVFGAKWGVMKNWLIGGVAALAMTMVGCSAPASGGGETPTPEKEGEAKKFKIAVSIPTATHGLLIGRRRQKRSLLGMRISRFTLLNPLTIKRISWERWPPRDTTDL
jgi:hypothetical protein